MSITSYKINLKYFFALTTVMKNLMNVLLVTKSVCVVWMGTCVAVYR